MNEDTANTNTPTQTRGQLMAQKARAGIGTNPDPNKPTLVSVDSPTRAKLNDLNMLHGGNNVKTVKTLIERAHAMLSSDELNALRTLERIRNR